MSEYADFLDDIAIKRQPPMPQKQNLRCIHDIIPEWCAVCRHENPRSVKLILMEENLSIVRNFETWPNQVTRTT